MITATPSPEPPAIQYTFTPTPTPTDPPTETPTPTADPTPVQIFADVPTTHWAYIASKVLYENGIVSGCGTNPLIYCPEGNLTRDQAAVFLMKAKYGPTYSFTTATPAIFSDVPDGNIYRPFIEKLYTDGVTGGCGTNPLIYCPEGNLTRDQAAVFLVRVKYGFISLPLANPAIFTDVPDGNIYRGFIEKLYNDGVTGGCSSSPLKYCPTDPMTRAAIAVMLYNLFF
jgi:hypothetical protein